MRESGTLGDQHEVPGVTNDRIIVDRLLSLATGSFPLPSGERTG
jgi:hypothetical protein